MTITNVSFVSESGSYTRAGSAYKQVYRVDFVDGFSAADLVHNNVNELPKYGELLAADPTAYVSQVEVAMEPEDDQQAGSATYTVTLSPLVADYQLNPVARPPEVEWGGEAQTEAMFKDEDDKACVNSAGDRYDPLPERETLGAAVVIARFEQDNPADVIGQYSFTTNAAPFGQADIGQAKMGIITAQKVFENGQPYWRVKYPLHFKRDGWNILVVDNGHRKLLSDNKTRRRVVDDMGGTSPVPCLLDGHGKELPATADPVIFPTEGYRRYPSKDWTSLNLPDPFA